MLLDQINRLAFAVALVEIGVASRLKRHCHQRIRIAAAAAEVLRQNQTDWVWSQREMFGRSMMAVQINYSSAGC